MGKYPYHWGLKCNTQWAGMRWRVPIMTCRVTAVTGIIWVQVLVINYVVKAVFSHANSRLIFKWSNLALQATDFAGCGCSACLEIIMWFSTRVISTPEQEFNIVKSSLFYRRETQYDCFSFNKNQEIFLWTGKRLSTGVCTRFRPVPTRLGLLKSMTVPFSFDFHPFGLYSRRPYP